MRASLLVALVATVLPVLAFADPTVPSLMAQAQRAYLAGDYDTAKDLFGEVVQMDPHNTLAIQFLRTIRQREAGMPPSTTKDPLKSLVLPKVELKDATFSSALDFFKHEAAAQSVTVSFVPQLPAAQMDHTVTLSLSQIPFLDALRYLCGLNSATYKVERYAIVISPATAAASPAPDASTPAPVSQ
jgi:hypothetical protein